MNFSVGWLELRLPGIIEPAVRVPSPMLRGVLPSVGLGAPGLLTSPYLNAQPIDEIVATQLQPKRGLCGASLTVRPLKFPLLSKSSKVAIMER